jgi:hypothetical protein
MSKRYLIFAAALVATGRSAFTTFLDQPAMRRPDCEAGRIGELSIEERSRLALADPEECPAEQEPAWPAIVLALS